MMVVKALRWYMKHSERLFDWLDGIADEQPTVWLQLLMTFAQTCVLVLLAILSLKFCWWSITGRW